MVWRDHFKQETGNLGLGAPSRLAGAREGCGGVCRRLRVERGHQKGQKGAKRGEGELEKV